MQHAAETPLKAFTFERKELGERESNRRYWPQIYTVGQGTGHITLVPDMKLLVKLPQ
jgi:hypothetical protein